MSHTLLLADDSVTVQRVIELTFADEGFKVVSFGDGDEVVGYLEAGNTPDVILADTTMPARDGYDVAAWVKGRDTLSAVPVVLMTGAFEPIDDKRAEACQADAILVKPFEPQQVVSLVKRMLAGERGAMLGEFAPPQVAAPPAAPGDPVVTLAPGLDTYAERLDQHLAARQRRPALSDPPAPEAPGEPTDATAESSAVATPAAAGASDPGAPKPSLADTFTAILAAERGEAPAPAIAQPELSDALVDAVAERVARRLSDAVLREVVSRHVLDVAERLVTDEIEKIKAGLA
jgi:CheY-like chemotaxis protein